MEDFLERFKAVFQRVGDWQMSATESVNIRATKVSGCYPLTDDYQIKTVALPREHPDYLKMEFVVIEIFYPEEFKEDAKDPYDSEFIHKFCAAMVALGIGTLIHNTCFRDDVWIIFSPINEKIYGRLPPVEQYQ